jgi:hypothetical protein
LIVDALPAHRGTGAVQVLQHEAADLDTWHVHVGDDVPGSYALDPAGTVVVVLTRTEELPRLLWIGDGEATHGCHREGRVVVDGGKTLDVSIGQVAGSGAKKSPIDSVAGAI